MKMFFEHEKKNDDFIICRNFSFHLELKLTILLANSGKFSESKDAR